MEKTVTIREDGLLNITLIGIVSIEELRAAVKDIIKIAKSSIPAN